MRRKPQIFMAAILTLILPVPDTPAETQDEIIANYRVFDPAVDTKVNCDEVTGQFFFKVKEKFERTLMVDVEHTVWETCWIYNPQTCQNEKVRIASTVTKKEPQERTYFQDVVYCVKLTLPVADVEGGQKCDCVDLPSGADPATLDLPPAGLFASLRSVEGTSFASVNSDSSPVPTTVASASKSAPAEPTPAPPVTRAVARRAFILAEDENSESPSLAVGVLDDNVERQATPVLRVRQVSSPASSSIWLRNDGDRPARIQHVAFQPRQVFETSPENAPPAGSAAVQFDHSSNSATSARKHGTYVRTVDSGLAVAANDELELRITILNRDHVGWGMIGDLTIGYEDGNALTIPGAQARFRSKGVWDNTNVARNATEVARAGI